MNSPTSLAKSSTIWGLAMTAACWFSSLSASAFFLARSALGAAEGGDPLGEVRYRVCPASKACITRSCCSWTFRIWSSRVLTVLACCSYGPLSSLEIRSMAVWRFSGRAVRQNDAKHLTVTLLDVDEGSSHPAMAWCLRSVQT